AFVYRAAVPPTRTKRRLVSDLLRRLFGGSGVDLVAALFEGRPPTEKQLDDLQSLLNDLRKRRRSGEGASKRNLRPRVEFRRTTSNADESWTDWQTSHPTTLKTGPSWCGMPRGREPSSGWRRSPSSRSAGAGRLLSGTGFSCWRSSSL